jgi:hypothetical protein
MYSSSDILNILPSFICITIHKNNLSYDSGDQEALYPRREIAVCFNTSSDEGRFEYIN